MAKYVLKSQTLRNYLGNVSNLQIIRTQSILASKLVFSEYGEPVKVLKKENEEIKDVHKTEIVVKMLAAPVNPADVNTIQGAYAVKPKLPAVGGNEGVGEVIDVGSGVTKFKKGDRVVPLVDAVGTWRTHAVLMENQLYKVPSNLGLIEAATLIVNPSTAYRMLKDFVKLKSGDVIIQNGANSACGQYVIQLCSAWGIKSVNIVRDRANINELKAYLTKLGATFVLTEEELNKTDIFATKLIAKPKLALNCVGGKSATEVMRQLDYGGTMVTYGGMSHEPLTVPISALIFKDVSMKGYWMTRWSKEHSESPERFEMFDELISLMISGKIHRPIYELVKFDDFTSDVENYLTMKGKTGKKYILDFNAL